jgi:hypothetical protein
MRSERSRTMKRRVMIIIIAVAVFAALAVVLAWAQADKEIAITKQNIQTERQQIVADYMELNSKEANNFWPVYRNYRSDMSKQNDRLIKLGQSFVNTYDNMTNSQARKMLNDFQNIQSQRVKIQSFYAPKFESAVGAKKTLRFYQLENKMDAVINYDLAGTVPLAE